MADKTQLTKEGFKNLNDELRNLIDNVREDVKRQLKEARAQGDLSENADYDAARAKQAEVEGRIAQIESILANCEIIDDKKSNGNKVALGNKVEVEYLGLNKVETFTIVGTVESDPFAHKISNISPLGVAIIDKEEGDIVTVKTDRSSYQVKINKLFK